MIRPPGILLLLTLMVCSCKPRYQPPIEVRTVEVSCGWGYEILIKDTVFIYQPHVPAVPGEKRFRQRAQAREVGEMVKEKIINGKSPGVLPEELEALKISSVSC